MASQRTRIETAILPLVVKPNRYIGNYVSPDDGRLESADVRVVVVHPDVFEIGFGDRDTRAAYITLNALEASAADMTFLPWPDLLKSLAISETKLWGLETLRPLSDFDVILFTPATPLQFVHIPRLLLASGFEPLAENREENAPLVAALGAAMANPAPIADFLDVVLLGEPAAVIPGLVEALAGRRGAPRAERRAALRNQPGVLDATAGDAGPFRPARLAANAARPVSRPLVPLVEVSDEGIQLEIRRGGLPYRHEFNWRAGENAWSLDPEHAAEEITEALRATGLDRVDFTGDHPWEHPGLHRLAEALVRRHPDLRIVMSDFGTSEPSQALARELNRGRRLSYTWSPLAGSERLRSALGVSFDESRFLEAVATAKKGGCHQARFRFGIGWPGETDSDITALGDLVRSIRSVTTSGAAPPRYQIWLEPFVPRAGTPLADQALAPSAEMEARIETVRASVEHGPVHLRVAPFEAARFEAALSRGDRRFSAALLEASREGAVTPTVRDIWDSSPWRLGFERAGIDLDRETEARAPQARPRDVIDIESPSLEVRTPAWIAPAATPPAPVGTSVFGRRSRRRAPPGAAAIRQASRYRIRFAKTDGARFTSHLDVGRAFERGLRRLGMSVAAARGRGVKLSFGPPLPLGMTSDDEYLDLVFAEDVPDSVPVSLGGLLPDGLEILESRPVRASVESLSHAIDRAHYDVTFPGDLAAGLFPGGPAAIFSALETGIRWTLSQKEILVPKSPDDELHRTDVRPGLLAALVTMEDETPVLRLHVMLGAAHAPRPESLLPALCDRSFDPRLTRIHRSGLRISGAGREFSPLEVVELDFPWWRETLKRRAAGLRS